MNSSIAAFKQRQQPRYSLCTTSRNASYLVSTAPGTREASMWWVYIGYQVVPAGYRGNAQHEYSYKNVSILLRRQRTQYSQQTPPDS